MVNPKFERWVAKSIFSGLDVPLPTNVKALMQRAYEAGAMGHGAAIPPAPHNFENTVQPALNALSLESLRDMQVHIADRIKELVQDHGPRVDTRRLEMKKED